MTRPLTVLHLAANRWWTGSADPTLRLASALKARGHRVLLGLIPGDRFEAQARLAGLDLVEGLRLSVRASPLEVARDARRLRALVRDAGIDVIHTHHSHDHWLSLLARPRAASGRRPAIARTFHNLRSVKRGAVARRLYGRTAAVFAVSRQIAERCRDVGIEPERIAQVPGIADLPRFASAGDARAIRAEFGLGEAPVIVTVSRLAANRGHELLLAGFRRLLDRIPDSRLLMVGKGETRRSLEGLVAELGLGRHVVFTGYRDRDLPEVLAAADCFALMAAGSDDSCRAALEAMAASRPVVARRVGALPETIVHGETGVLIEEESADSVAAALGAVLGDPARARAMGAAGRVRAEREFSVERCVGIVEREYRRVTGE